MIIAVFIFMEEGLGLGFSYVFITFFPIILYRRQLVVISMLVKHEILEPCTQPSPYQSIPIPIPMPIRIYQKPSYSIYFIQEKQPPLFPIP